MAARRKTYRLAPNWNYAPDTAITLSSVLFDADQPDQPLWHMIPDAEVVATTSMQDFVFVHDSQQPSHHRLWAMIPSLLGDNFRKGTPNSTTTQDIFRITRLETQYLKLNESLIARSIYSDAVKEYTRRNKKKPVYLVTGIKIAHGGTVATIDTSKVGLKRSSTTRTNEHDGGQRISFNAQEPFVFAYQLLEVTQKGDGNFTTKTYNSGALLHDTSSVSREEALLVQKLRNEWEWRDEDASTFEALISLEGQECYLGLTNIAKVL